MSDTALPPAALPDALPCPSCNATLRKPTVDPGGRIRCLNCGTRFTPPTAQKNEPDAPPPPAPPPRPASPGYWLLRVVAIIACIAALILTPLIMYEAFWRSNFRPLRFDDLMALSYVPLIPWGAVILATVQALIFRGWLLLRIYSRNRFDAAMLGIPLLIVALHYPTMWLAMLLREFLQIESSYSRKADDAAD
jgi:hypothetical protein